MSFTTDHEGSEHALPIFIPTRTLEGQALTALRTLAEYQQPFTASHRVAVLAGARQQVGALRAVGFALAAWHGPAWETLLEQARWDARHRLEEQFAPDLLVYLDSLGLVSTLRHSPADARLAPPDLGLQVVRLAVSLECLLVLGSPPEPPSLPSIPDEPLAPREQLLLKVVRVLAALELWERLPPGHRVTLPELRGLVETLRHALTQAAGAHGTDVERVLDQARGELTQEQQGENPAKIGILRDVLGAALIAPTGSSEALAHDALVLLALEAAAHVLPQADGRRS